MGASVVAVVPAKARSRRLPGKNTALLAGKPLLSYSIEVARKAESVDAVIVSSEDDEILQLAHASGAEALRRPDELSSDSATTQVVLQHVHQTLAESGAAPELLVLLQPTHPLRLPLDIDRAVGLMRDNPSASCLFSVLKTDQLLGTIENGRYQPEYPLPRRKALEPERYRNTGSIYVFRPALSYLQDSFFGTEIIPLVLDNELFEIDIDYPEDFELAEHVLVLNRDHFPHFNISASAVRGA